MTVRKVLSVFIATWVFAIASFALDLPANKLVDAQWLKANMADKSLVIIDVRNDKEKKGLYGISHIPGAILWEESDFREVRFKDVPGYIAAPLTITRLMQKSGITPDSKVVFYSDGKEPGSYTIAGLAVYIMEYYGFQNTAVLNGGFAAWEKAGFPVDNERVKIERSDWKITEMKPDSVASIYDVDAAVELNMSQIVDTRPDFQVNGTKSHPKVLKPGHLPGAKHIFVGNFTKTVDGVVYLDAENAKAQFAKANVDVTKPVIWYCNTSWYASGAWFAGKYLGGLEGAKVYDGSMVEYSRTPKRQFIKSDIK
jgi:thiosulfate/3-mercaptopyruvate sulfurtransferase